MIKNAQLISNTENSDSVIDLRNAKKQIARSVFTAFNNASFGILYIGLGGDIMCYNETLKSILSVDSVANTPKSHKRLYDFVRAKIKNFKDVEKLFRLDIKDYYRSVEIVAETTDDKILFCSSKPILNAGKIEGIVWSISDITQYKNQERIANYKLLHDPLTSLPNRSYLFDKLEMLTKGTNQSEQSAILFLDIDKFKFFNDTYGHDVGDELLVSCAGRIRNALREPDIFARLSGDEFVIILEHVPSKELVVTVIERIQKSLENSFRLSGVQLKLSISIGIAMYPEQAQTPKTLIRAADKAMYAAKAKGGNTFCFYDLTMEN